jgi:hypothetical protein
MNDILPKVFLSYENAEASGAELFFRQQPEHEDEYVAHDFFDKVEAAKSSSLGADGFGLLERVDAELAPVSIAVRDHYQKIFKDASTITTEEKRWPNAHALKKGAPLTLFMPLYKIDQTQHLVWGVCASETPDRENEVLDYQGSKPNFQAWSQSVQKDSGGASKGNVREMHQLSAVGTLAEINFDDAAKRIEICAKITDAQAWAKVVSKTYLGFSVGGRYEKTWPDAGGLTRYIAIPHEISLVDRPSVPGAGFSILKLEHTEKPKTVKLET